MRLIEMQSGMILKLVGRPQFLSLPAELGTPRADQLQGPDALKLIEMAGRTCYDSFGKGRSSLDYVKHIIESGHGSVLEHAQFTFFISRVSRGLTHELVRHRVGVAISQRSTRYVDESESPWILHPLLKDWLRRHTRIDDKEAKDIEVSIYDAIAAGRHAYRIIARALETNLTERGIDKLTARKQARGAARGFLGNALETELIWSANVRALRTVISQRASPGADAEIRELGVALLKLMQRELGEVFADYLIKASPDGLGEVAETEWPKV